MAKKRMGGNCLKKDSRGPICAAGLIIIGALVLLGRTLWAVEQEVYHPYSVASVIAELFFLMLNAGVYMSIFWGSHSRRLFQTLFLWMLALISIGMLGDVFACGIGLEAFPWYDWAHSLGSFLRDAMGFPMLVVYSIYLLSYVKEDAEELVGYGWLVSGLCLDGLLLVLINQITSRSVHQYWDLWDWPWVFFFFLALPICVNIGIIYSFRKMLTNRKAITFIFYELLVLAAVAADILLEHATFAYVTASFSMLLIYVSVQIEYERQQEEKLVQQRISIMLSQIQPHFLYNVLTNIRVLCRIDPTQAETALLDFTSYLRANLNSLRDERCISFAQELEHTRHYLELEKMRYGEDLQVVFNTEVSNFSLPALTLEPIVENAVRHGVMQRESGGTVTIHTAQTPQFYLITVSDDGVGFDPTAPRNPTHVGLDNVRERLCAMCGGELDVHSTPGRGTVVQLRIPKHTGGET